MVSLFRRRRSHGQRRGGRRLYPAIVTLAIAAGLAGWAAYALAGAGVLPALPWQKAALVAITAIYLLRGVAILPLLVFASQQATPFLVMR